MRAFLLLGLLLTAACTKAEAPAPPPAPPAPSDAEVITPAPPGGESAPSPPATLPPGFHHPIWTEPPARGETPTRIAEPVEPIVPEYTDAARKARIQGIVIVTAGIAKDGSVIGAYVIKGLPFGLNEKAVEAVEKAEFRPALAGDRPIDSVVNLEIEFSL